ncbi:sialate O-acetylesterase [Chitinophaga niabensis]|uniref:sialate O-acetylesterase n=1 Tax=Chitinophaga niabensis TaxID=536979 RepID=UPI0031BB1F33
MYRLIFFLLLGLPAMAQVKLPAIISDNMVLQQQSTVTLWGWAKPGEAVKVEANWSKGAQSTKADAAGKWAVRMKTGKAGGPYTLRFNDVEIKNVLLGEVWLASGQSNMEFVVVRQNNNYTGVLNYEQEIAGANYPNIRMIDVGNKVANEPQEDFSGKWKVCSPQTVDTFSAVAYYFAKEILRETGYPVGIINSTWGGTPAESWTKQEVLENDKDFKVIMDRFRQQLTEYPEAIAKHKLVMEKWRADTSSKKGAAPREPMGPNNSKGPYKLYNGMIAPIVNYTLKGVIWYQGESNSDRAYQYRRLFPAMIDSWRKDWKNENLPFYFVQISPHRGQSPEIRDAQFYTHRTVKHTGMVVTTDNGDSLDIHPRNKKLVGERLSRWALKYEYGKKVVVSGPLYAASKIEGNKIRISFDHADGLQAKDGPLQEFMIAGNDQQFVPAMAKIEGNTILVWHDGVQQPAAVRFAWRNFPHPNLFNKEGLPASPFKTDNWKQTTEGKN